MTTLFLQSLASGFLMGGVYCLIAIGLTIIYGVLKIVNFAHGEFMMVAMYVAVMGCTIFNIDPYLLMFLTVPIFFLFGVIVEKFLIKPTLGKEEAHIQILLTLGIALVMQSGITLLFGPDYRTVQLPYMNATLNLGNVCLSFTKLIACSVAVFATLFVHLLFKRTRLGKAIRAASQEPWAAQLVGINVERIYYLSFGIGISCVAMAGFLVIPFFYTAPIVGLHFTLLAFVVLVLGGLGSFSGALIGGFVIGLVEAIGGAFLPGSYQQLVVFSVFVLVLLFKPSGLFVRTGSNG